MAGFEELRLDHRRYSRLHSVDVGCHVALAFVLTWTVVFPPSEAVDERLALHVLHPHFDHLIHAAACISLVPVEELRFFVLRVVDDTRQHGQNSFVEAGAVREFRNVGD